MKAKKAICIPMCLLLALCFTLALSGCRRLDTETADGESGDASAILYQAYCEDSYKGYQADDTAALTLYVDGTFSIAHGTGLSVYDGGNTYYSSSTGTWNVEDSVLSFYNSEGELVGNAEGTDLADSSTWGQWGVNHYDGGAGAQTDYYSVYAFDAADNGDFVLTLVDHTYFYFGANGHISSEYIHTFTASEFIEAYNAQYGESLTEISLNQGTASPMAYYEITSAEDHGMGFGDGGVPMPSWGEYYSGSYTIESTTSESDPETESATEAE